MPEVFSFFGIYCLKMTLAFEEHHNFKCEMFGWSVTFNLHIVELVFSTVYLIFHMSCARFISVVTEMQNSEYVKGLPCSSVS
jgi:hypothetical protein